MSEQNVQVQFEQDQHALAVIALWACQSRMLLIEMNLDVFEGVGGGVCESEGNGFNQLLGRGVHLKQVFQDGRFSLSSLK